VTVAPPRPPLVEEPEALIPGARARHRRSLLLLAVGLVVALGLGLGAWVSWPRAGSQLHHSGAPISGAVEHSSGASARLRRIVEVGTSGGVTWVANSHGIWLTSNAGRSWRRSVPPNLAARGVAPGLISDVQFVDKRHGWMSVILDSDPTSLAKGGHHWEIDRTTDGGRTWHWSLPPGCFSSCFDGTVSFLDARHGYALAATRGTFRTPNQLFRTRDGGRTWRLVGRVPVGGSIAFLDDREGFAVESVQLAGLLSGIPEPALLSHTGDGGRTWSSYRIPPQSRWLQVPFAAFGRHLVVAGLAAHHINGPDAFYVSDDAGGRWSMRNPPRNLRLPTSFSAGSPRMWALSSGRGLFVTHDGGRSWRRIALHGLPPGTSIQTVVFGSSRVGWALVGPTLGGEYAPLLIRTTDGGVHWTPAGPRLQNRNAASP
jgi:photosystem II stability/assembly factor-like uncharacterized protein